MRQKGFAEQGGKKKRVRETPSPTPGLVNSYVPASTSAQASQPPVPPTARSEMPGFWTLVMASKAHLVPGSFSVISLYFFSASAVLPDRS